MVTALVLLAVAVVVGAVAAWGAWYAERWVTTRGLASGRERLAERLGVDDVELDVPARPLLPELLRTPGTPAQLRALDVPIGDDGRLRELRATLPDVHVAWRTRTLTTAAGTFEAVIGQEDLSRMVRLPGVVTRLELRASGLRVWTLLAVPVDAEVVLADGSLSVVPDPVQVRSLLDLPGLGAFRRTLQRGGLRVELPALPVGATIEDLRFGDGEVTVAGTIPPQALRLRPERSGMPADQRQRAR